MFYPEGRDMATNDKRTMTLNLTDREMTALDDLAGRKDLSKTQIIRQAIRLYQTVETRLEKGEKLFFEDEEKKSKSELMMI
jgi:predicted transcriptional regulator